MNDWKRVMLLAKRDLIVLLVCIVIGVTGVLGLKALADNLNNSVQLQQATLQEQQSQLAIKQNDLANMREHIQSYKLLRDQGLVGDPDRALWVEQLQSSYAALGLPGPIVVQLQAARPLDIGATSESAEATLAAPLVHELQFEIRESIEPDVLSLINNYRAQVKGRFRVNSCKWFEPKDTGITIQCVLRFVSIPLAPPITPAP